jgi:hypothetical protein
MSSKGTHYRITDVTRDALPRLANVILRDAYDAGTPFRDDSCTKPARYRALEAGISGGKVLRPVIKLPKRLFPRRTTPAGPRQLLIKRDAVPCITQFARTRETRDPRTDNGDGGGARRRHNGKRTATPGQMTAR